MLRDSEAVSIHSTSRSGRSTPRWCDLPDDEAAAAAAFTFGADASTQVETIKLLTVEETDAAIGRSVAYRPPGSRARGRHRRTDGPIRSAKGEQARLRDFTSVHDSEQA